MPSLFGSETDAIQERKLVKRLLRKKKITFILTALCYIPFTFIFCSSYKVHYEKTNYADQI